MRIERKPCERICVIFDQIRHVDHCTTNELVNNRGFVVNGDFEISSFAKLTLNSISKIQISYKLTTLLRGLFLLQFGLLIPNRTKRFLSHRS